MASTDQTIDMTIARHDRAQNSFNYETINGEAFSMQAMTSKFSLHEGRRYRIKLRNASNDVHPMHLYRCCFELILIVGMPVRGVIKDVVILGGFQKAEIDFVADNPGPTLFHRHQQLHMDFGLMALFTYA